MEKEKVYIFHIHFQIAMFLKTGVYNIYAYIKLYRETSDLLIYNTSMNNNIFYNS